MSAADHSDLLFMPRKQMLKSRRFIVFTIWMILIISFFVSIAYWWTLSGFEDAVKDPDIGWFTLFLLLMTVGTGAATELVKTVSLGYARNKKLWIYATIVSVITVMGTYAILDQDRKNRLQADSISHKSDVDASKDNQQTIKDTRHAANYDIKKLEKELAENKRAYRFDKKYSKPLYQSIKADLDTKIKDYHAYQAAIAAKSGLKQAVNSGGGDVVTNPLLDNVAKLIANGQTNLVVMAFYLAVTVLLEWAAYTLGGRVEAIDVYIQNVESHIADLTNMRVFGMSMKQVNLDVAKGAIHSQRQRIQFDKEMKRAVLEQTDEDGKSLSLDETNSYVDGLKKKASGLSASSNSTVDQSSASDLDLEGYTLEELTNRRDEYKKAPEGSRLCPACHAQVPNVKGQFYCTNSNHQAEFNNQLKRLKRVK